MILAFQLGTEVALMLFAIIIIKTDNVVFMNSPFFKEETQETTPIH